MTTGKDTGARFRLNGWDHFSAVMLMWMLPVALLILVPALGVLGPKIASLVVASGIVASMLLAPFFRYEVIADRDVVRVLRRVFGVPYSRERIERANLWVKVVGTGDWGDDGDLPGKRYCMIGQKRPYTQGTHIGKPKDAERLERQIKTEILRLGGDDGAP